MTRRFTTDDLDNLTQDTEPGPWKFEENAEYGYPAGAEWGAQIESLEHTVVNADGEVLFGQGNDHRLISHPGNLPLAAAAPELAAELHRIRYEMEERVRIWRKVTDKLEARGDTSGAEAVRHTISVVTRILEGDTNE